MNTLTGLKKLLAKLGGDPTKVDNNGDAIDAIAEAYVDHEGDKLPTLTSNDKGVFLFGSKTSSESSPTWKKTPGIVMADVFINPSETPSIDLVQLKEGVTRADLGHPDIYPEAYILVDMNGRSFYARRIGIDGGEGVAIFEGYYSRNVENTWVRKKYTIGLTLRGGGASAINYIKVEAFAWE